MEGRTVPELVSTALSGEEDDERAWDAIRELRRRGTEEVFGAAMALLNSSVPKERWRGVDILGQLGVSAPGEPGPSKDLRSRCADQLLQLLQHETDPGVLDSIGVALGHLSDPRGPAALFPLRTHPEPEVRLAVVHGMSRHAQPVAIEALIQLSSDPHEEVRNWATFGLGTMLENADTSELRDALVQRLAEPNPEIRGEALVGLAKRKDPRVVRPLREELGELPVIILAVEAAEALEDPSFLNLLRKLRDTSGEADDYFKRVLNDAITALENKADT